MQNKVLKKKDKKLSTTVIPCNKCKWKKTDETRGRWSWDPDLRMFTRERLYQCKVCRKKEWSIESSDLIPLYD